MCGQTGGNGGADRFDCKCEVVGAPFCANCFRWWMAVGVQTLVSLNSATGVTTHASLNATRAIVQAMYDRSPYTYRFSPSWAFIDDYTWFVLLYLDVARWPAAPTPGDDPAGWIGEAYRTFDLIDGWGQDEPCGGETWLYPDQDPRKNAITLLEAVQASARLAVALPNTSIPSARSLSRRLASRAASLWRWFENVGLLGEAGLVMDNVTGPATQYCCNASVAPLCSSKNSTRWTYNQGMLLGAAIDMHALTGDVAYLRTGARVLEAVLTRMTRPGTPGGKTVVLAELVTLAIEGKACDAKHDPSAPAGGDRAPRPRATTCACTCTCMCSRAVCSRAVCSCAVLRALNGTASGTSGNSPAAPAPCAHCRPPLPDAPDAVHATDAAASVRSLLVQGGLPAAASALPRRRRNRPVAHDPGRHPTPHRRLGRRRVELARAAALRRDRRVQRPRAQAVHASPTKVHVGLEAPRPGRARVHGRTHAAHCSRRLRRRPEASAARDGRRARSLWYGPKSEH